MPTDQPTLSLTSLRDQLRLRHITLGLEDDRLVAAGSKSRLTPTLDAAIRYHRDGLIEELRKTSATLQRLRQAVTTAEQGVDLVEALEQAQRAYEAGQISSEECADLARDAAAREPELPYRIEDMRLSEFANSGLVREAHSKTLGETVLWAADNAVVAEPGDRVVYRASELMDLVGVTAEQLRCVHALKKSWFDGEVVSPLEYEGFLVIPIEALMEDPDLERPCFACGQDRWWQREDRRICAVCHPPASESEIVG